MQAFLGDWVIGLNYGHVGRVCAKYHNFAGTNATQEWLDHQEMPIPDSFLDKPWYSILVHGGGAVLIAEDDLEVIQPRDSLDNIWADHYFRDAVRVVQFASACKYF